MTLNLRDETVLPESVVVYLNWILKHDFDENLPDCLTTGECVLNLALSNLVYLCLMTPLICWIKQPLLV